MARMESQSQSVGAGMYFSIGYWRAKLVSRYMAVAPSMECFVIVRAGVPCLTKDLLMTVKVAARRADSKAVARLTFPRILLQQ